MRIFIMTDLEGVAGVLNFQDWCLPESHYFDLAKELLTLEVNAAVEGFLAAGVRDILVVDGHGAGGINPKLLHKRVELMRGLGMGYPYLLDDGYDAVAWVGQHAKAGSQYAHLAHTQSLHYLDLSVNDVSVGEFGQLALCASELSVPAIFFSGDSAGCLEAQRLTPGIETVSVKRGTQSVSGDDLDADQYMQHNSGAIHRHPERARELIREGAERSLQFFGARKPRVSPPLIAPYRRTALFRGDATHPRTISVETHQDSLIELLNMPFHPVPLVTESPVVR